MFEKKLLLAALLVTLMALSVAQLDARPAEPGEEWVRSHPFTVSALIYSTLYWDPDVYKACNFGSSHPWATPTWPCGSKPLIQSSQENGLMWHVNLMTDSLSSCVTDLVQTTSVSTQDNGWYIQDEPPEANLPGIATVGNWLKQNRPNSLIYLNIHCYQSNVNSYIDNVMNTVAPDVLMYDQYPFIKSGIDINTHFSHMTTVRNKTLQYNVPYFQWIQAFSGPGNARVPSESEMRMQTFTTLAAGCKGISYFLYDIDELGSEFTSAMMQRGGIPTSLYYDAQSANPEISRLGKVLRYLNSNEVRYVRGTNSWGGSNLVPTGLTNWSYGAGGNTLITDVKVASGQNGSLKDGFIGFFTDDAGKKYFMLTNVYCGSSLSAAAASLNFTVTFDASVNQITRLNRISGEQEVLNLSDHVLNLNLPGGTGDLFCMTMNGFDLAPPTGGISINGGAVRTDSRDVTLNLSANDDKGVTHVRFGHDIVQWTEWENYSTAKPWTLTSGYGTKTVYGQFKDAVGTISSVRSASIDYVSDATPPSVPTNVQAADLSAGSIHVTWTASTDNVGVTGYRIFRDGGQVGTSTTTSYTDTGLQPETTYSYTVSAYDALGNNSAQSSPPAVATTPPDTEPPSVPTNVQGSALSMTTIQLTWTPSMDNVGVAGYRVYREGSLIGTNTWPNYTNTGLQSGTTYTYTVTAYDALGHESAHSSPPTVVTTPSIPDFCSVDLGSTDINNYLARVNYTADGSTGAVNAGGLNCRQPSNTSNQYFYFAIDDTYIYNGSVSTTYLEVCYYDDLSGSAFIQPQYDSTAGAYTSLPQVALTGTGQWKTATWTLNSCLFANRQNGGADFRLYVGPNLVKIDSVRISKSPFGEHVSVERDLGVNEVYGGVSHPQHADGNTVVQIKDEVYCKRSTVAGNNYFYFNVSDAVIYDGSTPTVYLKVGYYDSPDGLITPEYDSTSGEYTPATTLNFEGTNTWKEQVWALHNVKFANRQNASADFRLYVGTAQNVFIDTVVVSKMPFPDNEPPSDPSDLQAVGITPTAIRVTWTASTDNMAVAGYRIYRNGSLVETLSATDFTDTGLSPNTAYSYSVSAFDASGNESEHSAVVGTTMAASSITSAKELADLSPVGMVSQTVTAVFDGYLYIGEIDRYSGIRVVPIEVPAGIEVGQAVDIGGTIATMASGERCITSAIVHRR